ncbi:MAG: hypothetical protein WCI57_03305 [Candidatus Berkelbacteria bacterium]
MKVQNVGIYSKDKDLLERAADLIGDYFPVVLYHGTDSIDSAARDIADMSTIGIVFLDSYDFDEGNHLRNRIRKVIREEKLNDDVYIVVVSGTETPDSVAQLFSIMGSIAANNYDGVVDQASIEKIRMNLPQCLRRTNRTIRVTIVDDEPAELEGLKQILYDWPEINLVSLHQAEEIIDADYSQTDILLLDGDLGLPDLNGEKVAESLIRKEFPGVICSINRNEDPPDYTQATGNWHFPAKRYCGNSPFAAHLFVATINAILDSQGWST